MAEYSALSLLRNALGGNRDWAPAWRKPDPRPAYDVIIVGGGGHGLATAYYLAKEHGITNVAVLEKGYLGSGNVGRNTTIVRSNYLLPDSIRFYEHSLKLWENLSHDLNYNVMFSQRGMLNLAHTPGQADDFIRRGNAMRHEGVDAEWLTPAEIARRVPGLAIGGTARFPVVGGLLQPRGGTARHDAVAWGYARGADRRGVDIIENCEVIGFLRDGDRITGVQTTRGEIRAAKVGVAVAGNTGHVMKMAGVERLPIESHVLQAFVSESLKPFIHTVVTFGGGHLYVGQGRPGLRRRHRRLQYLCPARQFAGGRGGHVGDGGAVPRPGAGEASALLGRYHGHVDGRVADHHHRPPSRHVSQLRLVLRRLQGDASLGLVLRLDDCQGRATPHQHGLYAGPLLQRRRHRREGPGRDAPAALTRC